MRHGIYSEISLQEGSLLHGHYTILSVLGRGGFAFTYKAQDNNLVRCVAIKEYFPATLTTRSGISVIPIDQNSKNAFVDGLHSFIKEAQILAKFRNEHICSVLDYFQENGTAYLVMPYLSGESLDQVLNKCPNSVMNSDGVRKWLMPLLDALGEIHGASYMHRDIKPSNIYITFEGEPILIDFGAARASVGRTHGYTVVLTPEYAPPEQATTDISSQGPWTDIYALAAVAYRCLMGTPPPDAQKRVIAKANGEIDPIDTELPKLKSLSDPGLYTFIEQGLILPYTKRIQTIDAIVSMLDASNSTIRTSADSEKRYVVDTSSKDITLHNFIKYLTVFIFSPIVFILFINTFNMLTKKNNHHENIQNQNFQGNISIGQYKNNTIQNRTNSKNILKLHDDGISSFNIGLYKTAINIFEQCITYKNEEKSFEISSRQAECANYLAVMYSSGYGGLRKDQFKAFKLLLFAANLGNRSAQYNLGKRYKNGVGTSQDTQAAIYWYSKAASAGDVDAAKMIGYIYENGHGNVIKNKLEALKWYRYAYSLNNRDKDIKSALSRLQ